MEYVYIMERDYYKKLNIIDDEIILEEISNNSSFYSNLIKVYSKIYLELDEKELYFPLQLMVGDKENKANLCELQNKHIVQITGDKDITSVVESKDNNYYLYFYTQGLPLYLKKATRDIILVDLNNFKDKHYYYGSGRNDEQKMLKAGINFKKMKQTNYGDKKLTSEEKKEVRSKKIVSDKNLSLYMPITKKDEFYCYNDIEDIKNIVRIENNNLPRHKLLKKDKILQLKLLHQGQLVSSIPEYNQLLADNELVYSGKKMLKELSSYFYKNNVQHKNKKIFDNLEQAVCAFLSQRINKNNCLLISEKDQFILYYSGELKEPNDVSCRDYMSNYLTEKGIDINLDDLTLLEIANLIVYKNELIVSSNKEPVFLDQEGKNMPLHIIINHGYHHHGYYDNGIFPGIIEDEKYNIKIPELVNFVFTSVDNKDHVEVSVLYKEKEKIIDNLFYLPGRYYDIINKKLKKLFSMGLMMSNFNVEKWNKEKELNIESIFMPEWILNLPEHKEKELFKFLLQF